MTEYEKCTACGKWANVKELDTFNESPPASLCRLCSMAKREREDPPQRSPACIPANRDPQKPKLPAEKKVQENRKKKGTTWSQMTRVSR